MKAKITEVQEYFKTKLLAGDFKIEDVQEYVLKVIVDDEYIFNLWIANWHIPDNVRLYDGYYNFIMVDFTKEESIHIKSIIALEVNKFRKNVLLAQKRKEIDELERELKI